MRKILGVGIASTLAGLVVSSCNTLYEEPDAASPTAIVEFSRVRDPQDISGWAGWLDTRYEIAKSEACESRARIAATGLGADKPRRKLPAAEPVVLIAKTPFPDIARPGDSSAGGLRSDMRRPGECLALVRFTPQAGHTYAISGKILNQSGLVCEMKVVDKATDEPPADLLVDNRLHCPRP